MVAASATQHKAAVGAVQRCAPTTTAVRVLVKNVDIMKPRLTMQFPQTK